MQRETNRFDTQTARKENGPDKGGLHCACGLVSGRVVGGRIALFLTGGSRPLLRLRAQSCLQYRVRAHRQEGIVGGAQFDPVVELGNVVADRLAGALASHLGVLNDLDGVAPSLVLQRARQVPRKPNLGIVPGQLPGVAECSYVRGIDTFSLIPCSQISAVCGADNLGGVR